MSLVFWMRPKKPSLHVMICICTKQNPPCWMRLFPEHWAYKNPACSTSLLPQTSSLQNPTCSKRLFPEYRAKKNLPAEWGCSLSIALTKTSLLNKVVPWVSGLQNPPCSTSLRSTVKVCNKEADKLSSRTYRCIISTVLTEFSGWQCTYRSVVS